MQCKELEAVLADDVGPFSREAQEHLAGCAACRDLLADISAIIAAAKRLPTEVNPPERIWVAVRAQLEAEGIIRDVGSVETAPRDSWWSGFAQFFRPRVLATVAATALVVAGGIYFTERVPKPSNEAVATAETSKTSGQPARNVEAAETKTASAISPKHGGSAAGPSRVALPPLPRPSTTELAPSPTETAYLGDSAAVLADTESNLPKRRLGGNAMVDASLRQNLRTLNEFISECEARLKQNPQDQLTREYLNMAYQQKAELLTAMMDSGRSEH